MMIEPVTERWATDCSVFHGDSCPSIHGRPKFATPKMLWRKAKRAFPARCRARDDLLRGLMRDHGMLP